VELIIRDLRREDLPEVQAIFGEFVRYHEGVDAILAKIDGAEEVWGEYVYSSHTGSDSFRVLVAEVEGRIGGYCVGQIREKTPIYEERVIGEVGNIAVREGLKRRGIGERMFDVMRDWFAERGASHVELQAAVNNPQSMGFWRKMGGRPFVVTMEMGMQDWNPRKDFRGSGKPRKSGVGRWRC
jgi:ribosomal protein S18 acetylase RimI-like enzyme